MSEKTLNDLNVMNEETLVSPTELKNMIPAFRRSDSNSACRSSDD